MRKFTLLGITLMAAAVLATAVWAEEGMMGGSAGVGAFKAFKIYTDAKSPDNHYIPSGWMGDYGDIKVDDKFMQNPKSGSTSIKITYTNKATQGARWAGVYWQNPPNNWGTPPRGLGFG